jgi:hypothetical protein
VQLGDGICTSLWKDKWTTKGPFINQFPALYSHALRPNISVADCWRDGTWILPLKHITSDRAEREKVALMSFLNTCVLQPSDCDRRGWRIDMNVNFSVRNMYEIMNWGGIRHVSADTIWSCAAPKKGKVFAWLMIKGRIKVRSLLFRQNIVDDELCPFGCKEREIVEHFVLNCQRTTQILALLGIDLSNLSVLSDIYDTARDKCSDRKKKGWDLVITASMWTIWLSRNRKVFDDIEVPLHTTAKQCMETCKLWSLRARKDERDALLLWCSEWHI